MKQQDKQLDNNILYIFKVMIFIYKNMLNIKYIKIVFVFRYQYIDTKLMYLFFSFFIHSLTGIRRLGTLIFKYSGII